MRITKVEITNFRSIEHLAIDTDRPFVVLEGPNDSGKSNIVQAIDVALRHASVFLIQMADPKVVVPEPWPPQFRTNNVVRRGTSAASVKLSLRLNDTEPSASHPDEEIYLTVSWKLHNEGGGRVVAKLVDTSDPAIRDRLRPRRATIDLGDTDNPALRASELARQLGPALMHVGTQRFLQNETLFFPQGDDSAMLKWSGNNLKNILIRYKNSGAHEIQHRFEELRRQLADSQLPIGDLYVGLRHNEIFASTVCNGATFDLEDRSSGVQQLVFMLSLALCHEGSIVIIEEPELNLAKTLQAHFWRKLRELTGTGKPLKQIFVTSHSELFETEAGRIIVSRLPGGWTTAVTAESPPPKHEEIGLRPLPVTRAGALQLDADAIARLDVKDGGHAYLKDTESGLSLLSADEAAKLMTEGDA